jgi:hypothetical protein
LSIFEHASASPYATVLVKRIQPMPNVPLTYVSVYRRMSDIFHTLAYARSLERYAIVWQGLIQGFCACWEQPKRRSPGYEVILSSMGYTRSCYCKELVLPGAASSQVIKGSKRNSLNKRLFIWSHFAKTRLRGGIILMYWNHWSSVIEIRHGNTAVKLSSRISYFCIQKTGSSIVFTTL